jgi:hypothetical protein
MACGAVDEKEAEALRIFRGLSEFGRGLLIIVGSDIFNKSLRAEIIKQIELRNIQTIELN